MSNLNNVIKLNPLTRFCMTIGQIPSSYLISMTYEEQLIWLCDYLKNTVIPAIDNNADCVSELQELYLQLKNYVDNYFDDLDVQEEINKKLNEMTESGYFQSILDNFLNLTRVFNTTDQMINNSILLLNGQKIKTLGYHNIFDNGGAYWLISNSENNNIFQIRLNNGLFANLIIESEIFIEQCGAYGDNIHDDTLILQKVIDFCIANKLPLKSKGNKKFLISEPLQFNDRIDIDFNNSTIITNNSITMLNFNHERGEENQGFIKNLTLDMNSIANYAIYGERLIKKLFEEITILNISKVAYHIETGHEVFFTKSHFYGNSINSVGLELVKGDCHYSDIVFINVHNPIHASSSNFYDKLHAWIYDKNIFPGSIFMKCDTPSTHFLNQCYSDTFAYGFYVTDNARIKLVEHNNFINSSIVTEDDILNNGGQIFMFYFTNSEFSRYISVTNSLFRGYTPNTQISLFTNLIYEDIQIFADSTNYIANWKQNFKINKFLLDTILNDNFSFIQGKISQIDYINNVANLSTFIIVNNYITAGQTFKLFNVGKYAPEKEIIFMIPVSRDATYKIDKYCLGYINTNGDFYINNQEDLNSNSRLMINCSYLLNIQP